MAVTKWEPINQSRFLGSYVVDGLLDDWFQQSIWPVAETPLSQWLMDEVGYVKPPKPLPGLPRPSEGQGWPIWSNTINQIGVEELQIVRLTQAAYEALPVRDKFTMYILEG